VMHSPSLAARAQGARTRRDIAWVRSQKADLGNLGAADRRQIMRASLLLARAERVPWLRSLLRNECAIVDRIVIEWLIGQQ
jgi:hypothetical protein